MRLFIFDVGGVLCNNTSVVPFICDYLGMSKQEFLKFANQSGLEEIQTGKITPQEFWQRFSLLTGKIVTEDLWAKFFNPTLNLDTVKIVEDLSENHRVVAGTNTIESHYNIHVRRGDYEFFQAVYASHLIGFMKPDQRFYLHILEKEGFQPSQAVFIDDTKENVEAASRLGIESILFINAEELWQKLENLQFLPINRKGRSS
ncbi:HAD family hydrolase [Pseudothermotoga sp. U03pept]|uniref:HAD family hydrolase n=1 Tax=Pseudothermotoga sp. U03pept TaxID=3447012 RepID=UPI003F11ECC4